MARHPERSARPARPAVPRKVALLATAALIAGVLAGCTPVAPAPTSSAPVASDAPTDSASPSSSATPSSTAPPAVLVPDGTATDNLPLFTSVTDAVWATPERTAGRAYIDALVAAGFDKAAMQVTSDTSTVGNPAESIQFSVRWGDECLVGQVGPATGEPHTVVVPVLAEGTCLAGRTRAIDW